MKKYIILSCITAMMSFKKINAQCTDFNDNKDKYCIGSVAVSYTDNAFHISNFGVNTLYNRVPGSLDGMPGLSVLIQTGDGNFISKAFYPDAGVPIIIPYSYSDMNAHTAFVEVTKIYDGGGPRRSGTIAVNAKSNPAGTPGTTAVSGHLIAYPREIVQDDVITLIINYGALPIEQPLMLVYDKNNFNAANFVIDNDAQKTVVGTEGSFEKLRITNNGTNKNVFLRIKPEKGLELYDQTIIYLYTTDNNNTISKKSGLIGAVQLSVLSSHDPNNLIVSFCPPCMGERCSPKSRSAMRASGLMSYFTANFENTGSEEESEVNVTMYFDVTTLEQEGEFSRPRFAGESYQRTGDNQMNPASRTLRVNGNTGEVRFQFKGTLEGVTDRPYGHPSTCGSIGFDIRTRKMLKSLQPEDTIRAWADINFVRAVETIRTNVVKFTVKEYRRIYNKRCICQYRCFLKRWICRIFRRI